MVVRDLGIILFSGDNCVMEHNALPFLVSIPMGMEAIIFCELKPYFVSIMAFGSAPAALPQSAHNTPFTKLKSEMSKYQR